MAKIYNPQDQNGIGLINQTIFSQRTDDIQRKLEIITGYEFTEDIEDVGNLDNRIAAETIRASQAESRIESELNDAINAEKARASAREDAMEASFNDEINNVTLTINNRISELHGTISTVSTIINDEIERSTNQDTRLNSEIETLSEEIEKNKNDISALGLDIDAINTNINLISNPSIDILLITNGGEAELINEINLNVYTIDDSGNTIQVDTLPDIKISYQSNDAFIYTSNAVAYSPYINISGLDGNLNIETGENNITEARAQHDAILQFSGLLGIKEDITRIVIIDAIVAEGPENGYANCKHISRILPIKFHVAPNVTEEN